MVSSADSSEISLTIKGVLVGLVPYAIALLGLTHVDIGPDQLNALIDGLSTIVQDVLTLVSAVVMFIGVARKVWLTIKVHQQVTGTTSGTIQR